MNKKIALKSLAVMYVLTEESTGEPLGSKDRALLENARSQLIDTMSGHKGPESILLNQITRDLEQAFLFDTDNPPTFFGTHAFATMNIQLVHRPKLLVNITELARLIEKSDEK